jgi:multidrug efflux pump
MLPRFFIDRPIFAAVLSIVITLSGAIALWSLPIAQYPEISPPSIQLAISYPGASAQVVADTVAAPVEQQVNGVEGMMYMSSQSGNDGSYSLTVTFQVGTDLNTALVMVQNRVTLAIPQLPTQVQRQGITIRKRTPDILLVVNFYSPDGRYDDLYLSNFALIYVRDELYRVEGVSDINIFGERDYSVRIWLDPQKMAALGISAGDVTAAIQSQNVEAPAGAVGEPPSEPYQNFQLPVNTLGRLSDPEQFGAIIVKSFGYAPPAAQTVTIPAATAPTTPSGSPYPAGNGSMSTTAGLSIPGSTNTTGLAGQLPGLSTTGTLNNPAGQTGTLGTSFPATGRATNSSATTASSPAGTSSSGTTSSSSTTGSGLQSAASGLNNPSTTSNASGTSVAGGLVGLSSLAIPSTGQTGTNTAGSSSIQGAQSSLGTTAVRTVVSGPRPPAASVVRMRDIARVEMGAQNYNTACTFDGMPSVGLGVHQLPGSNALTTAERVRQKMLELKARFPEGVEYDIAYDITPFVRDSVADVVYTLLEAIALVAVVVLVFLQNWRTTLIPLVAVPVAIVGTFTLMAAVKFSLNNISLFGLVLAIGIVVDDAIVVVENVERWLAEGASPSDAARKAMDEVAGPVIAVALVLCAVFVPCAFISGITGRFFRQFAVTIAASTAISAFNSLTLSPALAAILLSPRGARRDVPTRLLDLVLGWFFRLFNKVFGAVVAGYVGAVGCLIRLRVLTLAGYAVLVFFTYHVFSEAPTGFIPEQDQGRLIVSVQLPDSASLDRTREVVGSVERIARETPGVRHAITISGMSLILSGNASNFGTAFLVLAPFEERRDPTLNAFAIMARLNHRYHQEIQDAIVVVLGAPPIPGLSVAGGFKLMVEDRTNLGTLNLQNQTERLVAGMRQIPGLASVMTQFRATTPMLYMDVDRAKAEALGVTVAAVDQALEAFLGSQYVNSFNLFGRYWQVTVQADGRFRWRQTDVRLMEVPNVRGEMVPLGTLVNLRPVNGPVLVQRYNLYSAAPITGNVVGSLSTGEAIAAIDALSEQTLPRSMSTEWTELFYIQIQAGNTALAVFGVAVVFVFLALAALYESWSLPLAVILVVPLCLLCSVAGVLLTHNSVNIFVQIGLVVLVGLACKNAILIVEFAKRLHEEGRPPEEAVLEACRLRLRPILMTSFAFILGVVPLVVATGAGAEMRRSLGTAVFAGMLGVTVFGIFLTPVFFVVIEHASPSRLLAHGLLRRAAFGLFGALVGAGFGCLLLELRIVPPGRELLAISGGAAGGVFVSALVLRGYSRLLAPPARKPGPPPAGPRGECFRPGDRSP